jgi:hypothetical protein
MRSLFRVLCVASLLAGTLALFAPAPSAGAVPQWAPAATASIHPGVQTVSPSGQCTSNFVFFDGADNVYLGQAAHCTGTGDATETDGCLAGTLPLGTEVEVQGASQPAVMVYNSWLAMQGAGETDPDTCAFNDFALLRLDPADYGNVNPSIPHWGGPNGINTTGIPTGQTVHSYGNSSLRLGLTVLSPKTGVSVGDSGGGWSHNVFTVTPGIPGDSGSAFLDSSGRAVGVLSTLQVLPLAGSNGVGDLSRELDYLLSHGGPNVQLALGTEAFNGSQLPIGL